MSTIYWCRGCGFEDTRAVGACGSCGSALASSQVEWLNEGDLGDETVYEVEVTSLQRAGLVEALITDGVRHRWDSVSEVVVATSDEEAVDKIFDDVLHEEVEVVDEDAEAAETSFEDDEDAQDAGPDEGYQAMSQLFFSSDRLLKHWGDGDVGTYISDATSIVMMEPPVGMPEESWAELQSLANNTATALAQDGEADVEEDVVSLRDQLKALI